MKNFVLRQLAKGGRAFYGTGVGKYLGPLKQPFINIINSVDSSIVDVNVQGVKFKLKVKPSEHLGVDRVVLTTGEYEPYMTLLMKKVLPQKGGVFVDVGANIGYHTIAGHKIMSQGGAIYAFEPIPVTVKEMEANLALNKIDDVNIVKAAATDKNGTRTIKYEYSRLGHSSFYEKGGKRLKVKTVRLDDYLKHEKKIDIVKIDVEGADFEVIKGMRKLFERRAVKNLIVEVRMGSSKYIEVGDTNTNDQIVPYMKKYGFEMVRTYRTKIVRNAYFRLKKK